MKEGAAVIFGSLLLIVSLTLGSIACFAMGKVLYSMAGLVIVIVTLFLIGKLLERMNGGKKE